MFFNRTWCCYPKTDFNELFDNILRGIPVHCGVTIRHIDLESPALIDGQGNRICGDVVISTLSIDRLFGFRHGELEYSGYDIEPVVMEQDHFHPQDPDTGRHYGMVYYPDPRVPQCRITEYKSFNNKAGDEPYRGRTLVTREVPNRQAKFYPLPDSHNEAVFSEYLETLAQHPRIFSIGRMGLYKYTTIDTTTEQVFRFIDAVGENFSRWEALSSDQRSRELHLIRGRHDN